MDGNQVDRGRGIALWRQIQETLEQEIMRGVYAPGAQLPPENELATRFGVNRHTLRRAVSELADRGLVRVFQGRGSFVAEDIIDYKVSRRTRFSEHFCRLGREGRGRVIRSVEEPASATVAKNLGLRRGRLVTVIERMAIVDNRCIGVTAHYFPAERFPGLLEAYAESESITKALQKYGVDDYFREVTRVTARMPSTEDARLLQQPRTRPILVTDNVNVDTESRIIEYGYGRWASDRVQLVFEPK